MEAVIDFKYTQIFFAKYYAVKAPLLHDVKGVSVIPHECLDVNYS